MNNIYEESVLCLNNAHMRLGFCSPAKAFGMLMGGGKDGSPPAKAVDIHYNYDEYGKPITDKMSYFDILEWEYWLMAEPRKGDLDDVIHTSKRIIRVPTIIVCSHFDEMPKKDLKPTPKAIRKRDGNRCQYTGVELTNKTFSLDHIIPRSKGGKNSWENLVAAHKDVNSKKGNRFNHEVGLKPLKKPLAPKLVPICVLHPEMKHPDHHHFP